MKNYGLDTLHKHLALQSPLRILLFVFTPLITFAAALTTMLVLNRLWPAWGLGVQIGGIALGFLLTAPFFWRRKRYLVRWGDKAYGNAFAIHVLTGLPVIFAVIVHIIYMPGARIIPKLLTLPIEILAWYLVLTGALLDIRAILSFGFDNLGMLYVYHPDEGRLVESTIYGLIRHPVYSAVIQIGMALALWNGSWSALAFGAFMPFGLTVWLRLVEERELIERFGEGYSLYRKSTPAFWPRVHNLGKFYRFLLRGT